VKALTFTPTENSHGKKDVTGAFLPASQIFAKARPGLEVQAVRFDNTKPLSARRRVCDLALAGAKGQGLDCVAWFCHGWRDGLQSGHLIGRVDSLARSLAECMDPAGTVMLYACDTARDSDGLREDDKATGPGGSGGFASLLYSALRSAGAPKIRVLGHSTAGHTTRNPYLRVWDGQADGHAGDWVVDPASPSWRAWVKCMRGTALPYDLPWLNRGEIAARIGQDL
jgi:hypothetical protein